MSDFVKTKVLQITKNTADFPWWQTLLVAVLAGLFLFFFVKWILKRYAAHKHIIKLKGIHIGLKEGFYTILHLKKRRQFISHSVFIWAMYLLEIYIGFGALAATSGLGLGAAFSVLSLATLAMIIAPGGIGAFPVAIQQVLLIYSIDNISFGWLIWGVTTAIIIIAGLVSFGLLIYNTRKNNETKQKD